jgi:hypothetical protein
MPPRSLAIINGEIIRVFGGGEGAEPYPNFYRGEDSRLRRDKK